ncbi:hypothetical protein [Streptomyces goshikiensis]|uniref:hypothetical protein n=1 Tax=Streptomyces goshikiensis TaxID=1942 RepID=UPI00371B1486
MFVAHSFQGGGGVAVAADLPAAGFAVEEEHVLTLEGPAVRTTAIEEVTARLGAGPVTAPMTAYVFLGAL